MKLANKKIKVLVYVVLIALVLATGTYILIKNRASADSFVTACYPNKTNCGMLTGRVMKNGSPLDRAKIEVNLYGDGSKTQMTTNASGDFKIWLKVNYTYRVDITPRTNGYTYSSNKQSFYDIKVTKVGTSNPTQAFTYTGPNSATPTPAPTSTRSTVASVTPSPTTPCGNIKPGNLLELNRCNNYQNGKYIGGIVVTRDSSRQERPVIAKLWAFQTLRGGSILGSPTSYTDSNGVFANIGPLTSGSYTIQVESDGCQTKSFPVQGSDRLIYDQSNKFVLVCNYTQTSSLSGIIKKQSNGAVVPNAEVRLMYNDSELTKQYTDSTGRYSFTGLKPATYSLIITADRCEIYKGTALAVRANENKTYNFPWLKCD